MTPEQIAKVCHEANRALCEVHGDFSQLPWDDAPSWQKLSCDAGVVFHLANPDAGPSASHDAWLQHKVADGWTYGAEKDPEKKTHPCIVPFGDLPPEQQAKDVLFRSIVHALRPLLSGDEA